MLVKLIRVKSSHQNLRTDEVDGEIDGLPEIGESITLLGVGLEFGVRIIHTTPVVEILEKIPGEMLFRTDNSTYRLKYQTDKLVKEDK